LGEKVAKQADTGPERMKAALLLPIVGGILMGPRSHRAVI